MKKILAFVAVFAAGLAGTVSFAAAADDEKAAEKIVVIVNAASPLPDPCPAKKFKGVFVGEVAYEKGVKLKPVNQKDPEIMGLFLKRFVGGSIGSYTGGWVKKLLSEGGSGPLNAESAEEVIKAVAAEKGAVGYLWRKDYPGTEKAVRELRIAQ